ncbi:MAG: hypothetical protein WBC70_00280 [Candidatus Aminicenantales bacterium]
MITGKKVLIFITILFFLCQILRSQAESLEENEEEKLADILRRVGHYCDRLEKASLDFVCLEEITEKIDYSRDKSDEIYIIPGGIRTQIRIPKLKVQKSYLYDYQFIRKGSNKEEKRVLLEKNGKQVKEEDSQLETSFFRIENVLLGPIGLLGEYMQAYHDYRIIGEEMVEGENALVLEAIPKPALNRPHCYGKIWVSEKDSSVLRIAWEQRSIGNYAILEERAKKYKADPVITSISEYGFEKNGLRFPSQDFSEEAYANENGGRFVRAQTSIIYSDYKFFTVETIIQYRPDGRHSPRF